MAQAKKKTATKTAKKTTARGNQSCRKSCNRTAKRKDISKEERMHIYIVTAMAVIAGILLCTDAAMMMV